MGVLYARVSGAWQPVTPWDVAPQTGTPFVIPDPVGTSYPALRFSSGDGTATAGQSNPYYYEWNLWQDRLRLYSSRAASTAVVTFYRPAANKAQIVLHTDWTISRDSDGYLRFYSGSAQVEGSDDEMALGESMLWCKNLATTGGSFGGSVSVAGDITVSGNLNGSAWITAGTNFTANGGYLYGNGVLVLSSNGVSYANLAGNSSGGQVLAGHQYGTGDYGKVCIVSNSANNSWQYRPFTITATGSAESGLSFYQAAKGWAVSMQMYWDGSYYIGCLNGNNDGYVKSYASAFNVQSSERFKGDVERLDGPLRERVRDAIRRVRPVRYRDLQEDLARAVGTDPADDYEWPEGMEPPERDEEARQRMREAPPVFRFGLIAEEVQEALPDLVSSSHLGPGIDLSGLIAVLWRQVQDLTDQVEALQSAP